MTKMNMAQQFCLEVKQLAKKYKLPFFVVTEGASATVNKDCSAVAASRKAHTLWEKEHGINTEHDWERPSKNSGK